LEVSYIWFHHLIRRMEALIHVSTNRWSDFLPQIIVEAKFFTRAKEFTETLP